MGVVEWLVLPPVAAAIGWFTNYIAVRMIFRPRNPWTFLGITLQGLLPKRRAEFARNIGETVHTHLFSVEDVKRILDEPEVRSRMSQTIESRVDDFLRHRLASANPMIGMFLQGPLGTTIRTTLVTELTNALGEGVTTLTSHLHERFDARTIVEAKILEFDLAKLEGIVLAVAHRELRAIEILGAVLGFLVGLIQVGLLALWS